MPPFRKSGSFVRFFVEGNAPSPEDDEFFVMLAKHRFRTIENAASEEISVGWVSASDPSGGDFVREDVVYGDVVRLRMRIDRKKLPPAWLAIYLSAEVRARNGHGVSARERKEIKADIESKLLPRILPAVQFVDVVWLPRKQVVLLFSTSQFAGVECAKLFHRTFDVRLSEADPTTIALRAPLPEKQLRYLEQIAPFRLETRDAEPAARARVPGARAAVSEPEVRTQEATA